MDTVFRTCKASVIRRLGNIILTEAMERKGNISFKSYDRFFPNQDTIPNGGFGNLVALLQFEDFFKPIKYIRKLLILDLRDCFDA